LLPFDSPCLPQEGAQGKSKKDKVESLLKRPKFKYYKDMKILSRQYVIFFFVVLIISPIIGLGLMREEFTAVFAARALFTATLSTVLYFIINRRLKR
jgi:hypothetical protein